MAGFGSISLTQTAVGTLLDQRAIVLYKQPKVVEKPTTDWGKALSKVSSELWGSAAGYEELFAGMINDLGSDVLSTVANVSGINPYGITYIDAKVNIESDLCDHPTEIGTTVTDASIILPVSAEVTVAMPTFFAERIYEQMINLYNNKDPKIILQTKYGLYTNMVLKDIEYELESETIDRAKFILSLREVQEVKTEGDFKNLLNQDNVENPSDVSTVDTGTQLSVMEA